MSSKHVAKDAAPESLAADAASWLSSMLFGQCCKEQPLEGELNLEDLEKKEGKAGKRDGGKESRRRAAAGHADSSAVKADVAKAGVPTVRRYKVDNSVLKIAKRPGIAFRHSKQENDKVRSECGPAKWGEIVEGISEGDGWLKVGDLYLPMLYQGVPVVTPVEDSEVAPAASSSERGNATAVAELAQKAPDSGAPDAEEASIPSKPSELKMVETRREVETVLAKSDESISAAMPADSIAARLEVPLAEEPPLTQEPEDRVSSKGTPTDSITAKVQAPPAEEPFSAELTGDQEISKVIASCEADIASTVDDLAGSAIKDVLLGDECAEGEPQAECKLDSAATASQNEMMEGKWMDAWYTRPSVGTWLQLPPRTVKQQVYIAPPVDGAEVCEVSAPAEAEAKAPFELELCAPIAELEWHLLPSVGTWLHAIPRAAPPALHAEAACTKLETSDLAKSIEETACVEPETCDKLESMEDRTSSKAQEAEDAATEGRQAAALVEPEKCDKLKSIEVCMDSQAPGAEDGAIEGQEESELLWAR